MSILKFVAVSAFSLLSLGIFANVSHAGMQTVKAVSDKVQVIPFITPENDPRNKDDYDNSDDDYYSDSDDSEYYNDHPQDSHVETGEDSDGGHWGYHYDTDDTSEYDKDAEPHWGYHYDDDVKKGAPTDKHYGHHAN